MAKRRKATQKEQTPIDRSGKGHVVVEYNKLSDKYRLRQKISERNRKPGDKQWSPGDAYTYHGKETTPYQKPKLGEKVRVYPPIDQDGIENYLAGSQPIDGAGIESALRAFADKFDLILDPEPHPPTSI
jgi:hypothetical protein